MREQEAAPAGGQSQAPSVPGDQDDETQTNNRFSDRVQDEFDIDDKAMGAVNSTEVFIAYKPIYVASHGYKAAGPIPITLQPNDDGTFKATIHYTQANKRKILHPGTMKRHPGPIEDKDVILNKQDVENLKSDGFDQQMGGPDGIPGMA